MSERHSIWLSNIPLCTYSMLFCTVISWRASNFHIIAIVNQAIINMVVHIIYLKSIFLPLDIFCIVLDDCVSSGQKSVISLFLCICVCYPDNLRPYRQNTYLSYTYLLSRFLYCKTLNSLTKFDKIYFTRFSIPSPLYPHTDYLLFWFILYMCCMFQYLIFHI